MMNFDEMEIISTDLSNLSVVNRKQEEKRFFVYSFSLTFWNP